MELRIAAVPAGPTAIGRIWCPPDVFGIVAVILATDVDDDWEAALSVGAAGH